jgi:hypothetical protein
MQSSGDANMLKKNYAQAARFSQHTFIEQNMAEYESLR